MRITKSETLLEKLPKLKKVDDRLFALQSESCQMFFLMKDTPESNRSVETARERNHARKAQKAINGCINEVL